MSNTITNTNEAASPPPRKPVTSSNFVPYITTEGKKIGDVVISNWNYLKSLNDISGCAIRRNNNDEYYIQLYTEKDEKQLKGIPSNFEGFRVNVFGPINGYQLDLEEIRVQSTLAKYDEYLEGLILTSDFEGYGYNKDEEGYYIFIMMPKLTESVKRLPDNLDGYRIKVEKVGNAVKL